MGQIFINLKEPELVSTGTREVWPEVNHDAVKLVCEVLYHLLICSCGSSKFNLFFPEQKYDAVIQLQKHDDNNTFKINSVLYYHNYYI